MLDAASWRQLTDTLRAQPAAARSQPSQTWQFGDMLLTTNVLCMDGECHQILPADPPLAPSLHVCAPPPQPQRALLSKGNHFFASSEAVELGDISRAPIYTCRNLTAVHNTSACAAAAAHGGVVLYFTEPWAHSLSHLARDAGLLAEILFDRSIHLDGIIAPWPLGGYGPAAREFIAAAALDTPQFLRIDRFRHVPKATSTCYAGVLQKAVGRPGHPHSWSAVRRRAQERCNTTVTRSPTNVVLLQRGGTRSFEPAELKSFRSTLEQSVRAEQWAFDVKVASFDAATYCEQVATMDGAAVVVAVHGQAVAGNLHLIHDKGTFIELFPTGNTTGGRSVSYISLTPAAAATGEWLPSAGYSFLYGTASQGRVVGRNYLALNLLHLLPPVKPSLGDPFDEFRFTKQVALRGNAVVLRCVVMQLLGCLARSEALCGCLTLGACHSSLGAASLC